MPIQLRHAPIALALAATLILTACQKDTSQAPEPKTKTAENTSLSEAKKIMDKVNDTVDTAVDTKMTQLENIEVADVFSDPNAYLAMNAKKAGVITTASGLQYRVITAGTVPKPISSSKVQVHYRGVFPNGSEFDSSYKRGRPASFAVTGVIAGWTEALLLMNEGSKWELVIPPALAYGERGAGDAIPPNQVLKFDVELLDSGVSE